MKEVLRPLFKRLDERYVMTFGLACFFGAIYCCIAKSCCAVNHELFLVYFRQGIDHPIQLLQAAEAIVVLNSLLIYSVRRIIIKGFRSFEKRQSK